MPCLHSNHSYVQCNMIVLTRNALTVLINMDGITMEWKFNILLQGSNLLWTIQ